MGEIRPTLEADEIGVGQARFEPFARRSLANHDDLVRHAAPLKHVDGVGKNVEPLFHPQPPEECDGRNVVLDPERAAPRSEVRSVGKEGVSSWSSRWSPYH